MEGIIDLIENLNKKKNITKNKPNIIIPEFIFGNEMDDTLFLALFETIIKDISNKNNVNASGIKSFFQKIKYNTLYSIFNNEEIISKIKKDIIINALIDKGLYDNKPDINLTESIKIIKGFGDKEFSISNININFNEVNLNNNEKFKLDKNSLKEF